MQPLSATASQTQLQARDARLFGLGSIALAGLLGGPLAAGYLVVANTRALRLQEQTRLAVAFFALATGIWIYALYQVPGDLISQLIPHIPQVVVWLLFARFLLRRLHADHKAMRGLFRSAWAGAGIGLLVSIGVRVTSFVVTRTLS